MSPSERPLCIENVVLKSGNIIFSGFLFRLTDIDESLFFLFHFDGFWDK